MGVFQNYSKRNFIIGFIVLAVLGAAIFFFTYFYVDYNSVVFMDNAYYTEAELREKVLKGPFAYNAVLAPIFCGQKGSDDHSEISGIAVTRLSHDSLCVTVKVTKPVGCVRYLDSYIYFDINGVFTDSSREYADRIPLFRGLDIGEVRLNEKIPFTKKAILDTAIALSEIYQDHEEVADYVELDNLGNIQLIYGDILVKIGTGQYLEDKIARLSTILPKLAGMKGILHMEGVTDINKNIIFEKEVTGDEIETWNGGYDEDGNYTGDGEYDLHGNYVGPRPIDYYGLARAAWPGGWDEEGDSVVNGPYDKNGIYVGPMPTRESIAADGDWHGGYDRDGRYVTNGEYDYEGNHVGPRPGGNVEAADYNDYDDDEYDEEDYEEYSDYEEDYDEDYE